jgi:regulator of ribosome biosynthesis
VLPSETSVLPREKRIPEPKPETRWEKFSKEKGIKNKKRERMVYEEDTQEWKPRFGYKRAKNGVEDHAIVEVKAGQDPFADPWAEARVEKKERVAKNLKNQTKNIMRATGGKGKRAIGESTQ